MTNKQLREARKGLGLTQKRLALLMGINQRHYSPLETGYEGRSPTKQHAATVAIIQFIFDLGLLPALLEYTKRRKQ